MCVAFFVGFSLLWYFKGQLQRNQISPKGINKVSWFWWIQRPDTNATEQTTWNCMENAVSCHKFEQHALAETASLAKSEANQIYLDTLKAHIIWFF